MNAINRLAPLALLALATSATHGQFGLPDETLRAASGGTHEIAGCVVGLVTKIDLAAPESGILNHVSVIRGSRFQQEDVLAEIDSREAQQAYKRAYAEYELAIKRAEDDIEIRYADAQELVEKADYDADMEANRQRPGAVPAFELRKSKLEWDRARLGAEKARKDTDLALGDVRIKKAELDAAEIALEKRQVRARFNGEVLKLHREEGEWVQAGERIAEIARLDTLQVDGKVYYDEHDPRSLAGCRVTVDVNVGRGKTEQATGYITYVDPIAQLVDKAIYTVRAEISNREEGGGWIINPGLQAKMTIHLGTAGENAQLGRRGERGRRAR